MSAVTAAATPAPQTALARTIGASGYFALAFGSIVGSGWVLVLGDWISAAAPGGAILGFLAGGLLMTVVAAAYAELAARFPEAGGEFIYVLNGLGPRPAFLIGWLLTLPLVAFTAFEGVALGWFVETIFPAIRSDALYTILGEEIYPSTLILGIGGAIFFAGLNYIGSAHAVLFQRIVTYGFIAVAMGLVIAGLAFGRPANILPAFDVPGERSWTTGAFWIFATSTVFLNGFQSAVHAVEERTDGTSLRQVAFAMTGAVAAAALFYCLLILAASSAVPWRSLIERELPAAAAFGALFDSDRVTTLVLAAATISLLKTWNALHLGAARLTLAQARQGFLPVGLATVHRQHGTPSAAIVFVGLCTVTGVLLGRGAILPIVNMSAICTTAGFFLCLLALLRLRRAKPERPAFSLPGGTPLVIFAMLGVLTAAATAIGEAYMLAGGIPLEWYVLAAWTALGLCLWLARTIRDPARPAPGRPAGTRLR